MVKKIEAIRILQKEYNYEESLMYELTNTFLAALPEIRDLSPEEIKELNEKLTFIRDETSNHKKIFESLIDYVNENGSNSY